ncbi:MAG: molybdate ABC transporter substrate-binding protein [Myxococcota bacterium]|nr:molybdate ABC transporter substrate-binding protein [Myxococcota bacterium]
MKTAQVLCLSLCASLWCCAAPTDEPTVAAAASLRHVMPALVQTYAAETGRSAPQISYGASGKIVGQVLAGAPISGVVLASARQLQRLSERQLIRDDSVFNLATNRLVLARRTSQEKRSLRQVIEDAGSRPLAIGDPRFVPAGRYAQELLEEKGLWAPCEEHLIRGGHVAAVLAYLQSGAVDTAIVYETDLRGQDELVGLPLSSAEGPSTQVLGAELASTPREERVNHFLRFLSSEAGQLVFRSYDFGPPR